ncbi:MAG: hypothetical protein E7483_05065 [Ruminococcaceae bacterium]|nr:hypothetical protein [Oscillospiraceae bacterium]
MNRIYSRKIRRYIIACIMLVLSGFVSVAIKDNIDARNPEVSLPIINVTTGYTVIPTVNVPRAGYEWSFGSKTVRSPYVSSIDVPIVAYEAMPNAPILIGFTMPHTQLTLYESKGVMYDGKVMSSEEFKEKRYSMNTPKEDGIYVYKAVAQFDRGNIVHYFALNITSAHTIL